MCVKVRRRQFYLKIISETWLIFENHVLEKMPTSYSLTVRFEYFPKLENRLEKRVQKVMHNLWIISIARNSFDIFSLNLWTCMYIFSASYWTATSSLIWGPLNLGTQIPVLQTKNNFLVYYFFGQLFDNFTRHMAFFHENSFSFERFHERY